MTYGKVDTILIHNFFLYPQLFNRNHFCVLCQIFKNFVLWDIDKHVNDKCTRTLTVELL